MVIGVTGYGGSGASAYVALIKEFESVQYYDRSTEFQILQQPDGITDLRYNIVESRRRLSINSSICRYIAMVNNHRCDRLSQMTNNNYRQLSLDYIKKIIDLTWKGKSTYDPVDLLSYFEKPAFKYINAFLRRVLWTVNPQSVWPPTRDRYYTSISEERFIGLTREYLYNLFKASGFDLERPILLEQLFSIENPLDGKEYFDDVRSIIVDRDPRDFYTLTTFYWSKSSTGYMPNDGDVEKFVDYYQGLHCTEVYDPKLKYVRFEDLIFRYEDTIEEIGRFLGLKHVDQGKFFKPELSINNTQVYKNHPEIESDIRYIEEKLSEFIYPFEKYEKCLNLKRGLTGVFDDIPNDLDSVKKRNRIRY